MARFLTFLIIFLPLVFDTAGAVAARSAARATVDNSRTAASNFVTPTAYETMYPAMNNEMKTSLNPGTTPNFSPNSVSTLTRTSGNDSRRVVARSASAKTVAPINARSGTPVTTSGGSSNIARSATNTSVSNAGGNSSSGNARRVIARKNVAQNATVRSARSDASYTANSVQNNTETIPAARCLADYTTCMNGYCQRKDMAYNRCYCSSKLAQIDATYQPAIDNLIKQIINLTGTNKWSTDEMNEYWDEIIGVHTGDNSWVNLENALNINWADTESRVRGQTSFLAGHDYCAQHLRGCYYMADNMRDAYRSDIARDCSAYENSLQRVKEVAESFVESYNE